MAADNVDPLYVWADRARRTTGLPPFDKDEELDIRKILVPLKGRYEPEDPASLDAPALQTALKLARHLDAQLEVLSVISPPTKEAVGWINWMPDYGMDMVLEGLARQGEAKRRNARKSYETHVVPEIGVGGLQAVFVEKDGDIRATVGSAGRLSDLIVVASSPGRWEQPFRPILDAALRETARPIFVAPETAPDTVGKHVTIAWNDSREAARAVAGAMPMLRKADSVSVLICREEGDRGDPSSMEAVISYLDLHNVKAQGTEIISKHRRPAREIVDAALARGSDLLVLGSVIHSRAHNLVYGSLTEEVLKTPRISAFLVP